MIGIPQISVCIPTFNGAQYLRECLDSIIWQTFKNIEILIVDDCSSDETLDLLRSYESIDSRVRVVVNKCNLGLVGNWNKCVELTRGEWIKFVFQDDYLYPDCLRALYEVARPEVGITGCARKILFEGVSDNIYSEYEYVRENSIENLVTNSGLISADDFCSLVLDHIGVNFVGEPTSVMLHRSVFDRFGSFNANLVQMCDFEYWARVACNNGFSFVREELAAFRVHSTNTSMVNYHEKAFRSEMLEVAILLHEYIHNPHFERLRWASAQRNPAVDFKALLRDKAYWCYATARSMVRDPVSPSIKAMTEWNAVIKAMPAIRDTWYFIMKDLGYILDRNLFWRFRRLQ